MDIAKVQQSSEDLKAEGVVRKQGREKADVTTTEEEEGSS